MPELCGEHWIIAIGLFEKNILPKQLCSEQYDFNTSDKFFLSVWDSLQSLKKNWSTTSYKSITFFLCTLDIVSAGARTSENVYAFRHRNG